MSRKCTRSKAQTNAPEAASESVCELLNFGSEGFEMEMEEGQFTGD
jgi:hypothetical protein